MNVDREPTSLSTHITLRWTASAFAATRMKDVSEAAIRALLVIPVPMLHVTLKSSEAADVGEVT